MKPIPNCREKHYFLKKEISHCFAKKTSLFYSTCIAITMIFCFYLIFDQTKIKYTSNINNSNASNNVVQPNQEIETCNLFEGQWIPDPRGPLYSNHSCTTIPASKNCLLHGRKDRDFLHWRWKPHKCELPRFNPKTFLSILRGKKMAFIGDSLARNQMESLLCLLSTVETPKLIENDAEDRFTTWEFPKHNFTLTTLWSKFLVEATELKVNGTNTGVYNLHLDRVDARWSEKLPSVDYAVTSASHWYFRQLYLYEGGNLVGNMTEFGPGWAIKKAFQTALKAINDCKNCNNIVTFLRTHSPSHFENGSWNGGGGCNRTRPVGREEIKKAAAKLEYRRAQVEEVETAKIKGVGSENEFRVLDITEMMMMRVDGHPGVYWGNRWMKGYSDCVHWCMPGPIDTWNELLLESIKRERMAIL